METEKFVFALLATVLLAGLAFVAVNSAPKQPVAFFAYGSYLAKSTMNARAGGFLNATAARMPIQPSLEWPRQSKMTAAFLARFTI